MSNTIEAVIKNYGLKVSTPVGDWDDELIDKVLGGCEETEFDGLITIIENAAAKGSSIPLKDGLCSSCKRRNVNPVMEID